MQQLPIFASTILGTSALAAIVARFAASARNSRRYSITGFTEPGPVGGVGHAVVDLRSAEGRLTAGERW